ncbi:MAG: DUF1223 domain-containing protein [Acidobacteriota bacterium]
MTALRTRPAPTHRSTPFLLSLLAAVLWTAGCAEAEAAPETAEPSTDTTPVIVELFTSQGCSSCPPADRLLTELAREGTPSGVKVIPLSFHVDYWNYIGWTDPFSSSKWSKRQTFYARKFGSHRVYTPQLVIDGVDECVGSDRDRVYEGIERAGGSADGGKVAFTLDTADPQSVGLSIDAEVLSPAAGERWRVMVAVYENDLETPVSRGENGGRTLSNGHVVRELREASVLDADTAELHRVELRLDLGADWRRGNLGVVVFLQDPKSRRIHGAAAKPLRS